MGNASAPPDLTNQNIIFFDGVCHLCNAFVDAIVARDKAHIFQFAPLQGDTAKAFLSDQDRNTLESVIYFESGRTFQKSSAVLRILTKLGGLYKLAVLGHLMPRFLRDAAYEVVARNRYTLFGKRETCRLPTPEERRYLLP